MIKIVELFGESESFEKFVNNLHDKIIYKLKSIENTYIIDINQEKYYQSLKYIKNMYDERIGNMQDLHFTPQFTPNKLKYNSCTGWGA